MVFPQFLVLPRVTRDLILQNLDPIDILNFSLTSKKSLYLAKSAKVQVDAFNWDFKTDGNVEIKISKNDYTPPTIIVLDNFYNVKLDKKKEDCLIYSEIASIPIALLKKPSPFEVFIFYRPVVNGEENPVEMISQLLLGILKVKTFSCETKCNSKIPFYIFNFTRSFEKLSLSSKKSLTHEEAQFLLEDLTVDNFRLTSKVNPGFLYTKPLSYKYLSLTEASWFTKETLMNLVDCERITLSYHPHISNNEVTEFLEKWQHGGFPKLKVLAVFFSKTEWNLAMGPLDDRGLQVLKDSLGNVGKIQIIRTKTMFFYVNDAEFESK